MSTYVGLHCILSTLMTPAKSASKPPHPADLIEKVAPAVALVKVTTKEGQSRGSAFAVKTTAAQGRKLGGAIAVTNAHVVEGESPQLLARFGGGFDARASLLLTDPVTDVAFIVVDEAPATKLVMRDTASVRLGETVFAIGSPYGFECSVSQGVVSGVERSVPMENPGEAYWARHRISGDMVQTDALVLQGNSGGPLIDDRGAVVGMNTRGYIPANAYSHASAITLAVAASTISKHLKEFFEFGDPVIKRSAIAAEIGLHDFSPEEQRRWNRRAGAKVAKVTDRKGPAAVAGLKRGDVIIEFRGEEIDHFHDLQMRLDRWTIGDECPIAFVRSGELVRTSITPREKKAQ